MTPHISSSMSDPACWAQGPKVWTISKLPTDVQVSFQVLLSPTSCQLMLWRSQELQAGFSLNPCNKKKGGTWRRTNFINRLWDLCKALAITLLLSRGEGRRCSWLNTQRSHHLCAAGWDGAEPEGSHHEGFPFWLQPWAKDHRPAGPEESMLSKLLINYDLSTIWTTTLIRLLVMVMVGAGRKGSRVWKNISYGFQPFRCLQVKSELQEILLIAAGIEH